MAGFAICRAEYEDGGMDLAQTLFCGQSFSWREEGAGRYTGVAGHRAVTAWQDGGRLYLERLDGAAMTEGDRAFWRHYFALDVEYAAIQDVLCQNPYLAVCVGAARGIRVLRQPFFETLLSFIISQNNNITRIAGIVQRLCSLLGQNIGGDMYAFPTPQALAGQTLEDLQPLRAGFRAKYLLDAAQKVAGGAVREEALQKMDTPTARKALQGIYGVGPKVADCVLLFSLSRYEVAPMDVWMKRAMEEHLPKGMPACAKGYEGIAQQYIFHNMRTRDGGDGKGD